MSEILYGGPVAERLRGELRGRIDALLARGVDEQILNRILYENPERFFAGMRSKT